MNRQHPRRGPLRRALPAVAILALVAATAATASEWEGEISLLAGHHDNFFFRGSGGQAPSSDLISANLEVDRTIDTGPGEWTVGATAAMVAVIDIDSADYQGLGLVAEYKRGPWKAAAAYEQLLNRLFSESGEAVFFDEAAVDLWLRYSVNRRLWVRLRAEVEEWDFDASENARDADVDKFAATVRMAVNDKLAVRLSYLVEERAAVGAENNRSGTGVAVALEGAPRGDLTWFLRFRSRDRDYEDAVAGDSNLGRSDTVEDINFNLRWTFAEAMGLILRDSYRSGSSTRLDRNFTGNVIEAGVFFQFGSP